MGPHGIFGTLKALSLYVHLSCSPLSSLIQDSRGHPHVAMPMIQPQPVSSPGALEYILYGEVSSWWGVSRRAYPSLARCRVELEQTGREQPRQSVPSERSFRDLRKSGQIHPYSKRFFTRDVHLDILSFYCPSQPT